MARDDQGVEEGVKGGWAEGLGEKVLEVRTPKWRSETVRFSSFSAYCSSRSYSPSYGDWEPKKLITHHSAE